MPRRSAHGEPERRWLSSLLGVAAAEDGRLVAVGGDCPGTAQIVPGGLASTVRVALLSADGVSWTRAPHDEAVFGGESSEHS